MKGFEAFSTLSCVSLLDTFDGGKKLGDGYDFVGVFAVFVPFFFLWFLCFTMFVILSCTRCPVAKLISTCSNYKLSQT